MNNQMSPLPQGYADLHKELKATVAHSRWQAQRRINTELIQMYWRIGHTILTRQHAQGWGGAVVERLATCVNSDVT